MLKSESTVAIDIRIYVTSKKTSVADVPETKYADISHGTEEDSCNEKTTESDEKSLPEASDNTNSTSSHITIANGRPNIQDILSNEISSSAAGNVGVGGKSPLRVTHSF